MTKQLMASCSPNKGITAIHHSLQNLVGNCTSKVLECHPGIFDILARPTRWTTEENLKRVRFYSNKSYSYIPSQKYVTALAAYKGIIKRKIANVILNEF